MEFPPLAGFSFCRAGDYVRERGITQARHVSPAVCHEDQNCLVEPDSRKGYSNLFISVPQVESVIRDPRVVAVTLTASERAGRSVAAIAGSEIKKKTVLELGGSDPFIVLADADIPYACQAGVMARLQNNGQSCIAAKRLSWSKNCLAIYRRLSRFSYEKTWLSKRSHG